MVKSLLAAGLFLFAAAAVADDTPPAPKAVQPKVAPAQPGGLGVQPGGFGRVSPTALARYEEEAEVLEAQLDVKKAYIRAAEVGYAGAKLKLDRVQKLEASKAITSEELSQAKIEVEAAGAQLEIRKAESKEVEVKLKHAKKRVEDGKAGVRVAPAKGLDPRRVDPIP